MFDITIYDINDNPIEKLYQYDTCVKIKIKDLDFEEVPVVHFCNRNSKEAFAILKEHTNYEGGVVTVEIPTPLLEESLMIYVYLYAYDTQSKSGRTIHVGNIPVCAKPKPEDYVDAPEWRGLNVVDLNYKIVKLDNFISNDYINGMNNIDSRIKEEIKSREDSDVQLSTSLANEILNRENGDNNLDAKFTKLINKEADDRQKAINDAFNDFSTKVSDDNVVNTYKELIDYAAENGQEIVTMAGEISKNETAISSLSDFVGTLPEDRNENTVIEYVDAEISTVQIFASDEATKKADAAEKNAKEYASGLFTENNLLSIFNAVYPVGSIYMSTSDVNPSILFGGEWEEWGQGRVPVGVNASDTDFATSEKLGGNKYLQSHNHSFTPSGTISNTTAGGTVGAKVAGGTISNTTAGGTVGSTTAGGTISNTAAGGTISNTTATMAAAGAHSHTLKYEKSVASGSAVNRTIPNGVGGSWATQDGTNSTGSHTHTINAHSHTFSGTVHGHSFSGTAHSHTFSGTEHGHTFTGAAHDHTFSGTAHTHTFNGVSSVTDNTGNGSSENLQPYITCYMWKRVSLNENFFLNKSRLNYTKL